MATVSGDDPAESGFIDKELAEPDTDDVDGSIDLCNVLDIVGQPRREGPVEHFERHRFVFISRRVCLDEQREGLKMGLHPSPLLVREV